MKRRAWGRWVKRSTHCTSGETEDQWTQTHALTYPADTRESDPSTTPPLNSTAIMVVCRQEAAITTISCVFSRRSIPHVAQGRGGAAARTLTGPAGLRTTLRVLYSPRFSPPRTTTLAPSLPACRRTAAAPVTTPATVPVCAAPGVHRNVQPSSAAPLLLPCGRRPSLKPAKPL